MTCCCSEQHRGRGSEGKTRGVAGVQAGAGEAGAKAHCPDQAEHRLIVKNKVVCSYEKISDRAETAESPLAHEILGRLPLTNPTAPRGLTT